MGRGRVCVVRTDGYICVVHLRNYSSCVLYTDYVSPVVCLNTNSEQASIAIFRDINNEGFNFLILSI